MEGKDDSKLGQRSQADDSKDAFPVLVRLNAHSPSPLVVSEV